MDVNLVGSNYSVQYIFTFSSQLIANQFILK